MQYEINKNKTTTSNSVQIAKLKEYFPSCFDKKGRFLPHKLEEIVKAENVDITREGYKLDWLGKSYARLLANLKTETLLQENKEHNIKPENVDSQNLLIQGDNLDVLKHLVNAYSEKVKIIYIDPPYNTGSDGFVYSDNRKFKEEELSRLAGINEDEAKRILNFTQSKSNSHSAWLTFMYPRLYIARELLREDGLIFISIDDNEQAQLKLLCEEIFGEENFEGLIHWRRRHNQPNDKTKMIGLVAENILVFAKNSHSLKNAGVGKVALTGEFKNTDNDIRGDWASKPWKVGSDQGGSSYKITSPTGVEFDETWMGEEKTFRDLIDDNRILWTKGGNGLPRKKYFHSERVSEGQSATNWWNHEQFGHNQEASNELAELFDGKKNLFSNPKGTKLLKNILQVSSTNDDFICMDFFAGSGTTAHAVMALNAEYGGNRKFICVQLDESTDEKSDARMAGYNSIFEITRERIILAAQKVQSEYPNAKCDFSFKEFKTISANEGAFAGYLDDAQRCEDYIPFNGMALDNKARHALLTTWQAYDGLPISNQLLGIDLGGYTAYQGGDKLYFINAGLKLKHIITMLGRIDEDFSFAPRKLVVFHHMLNDKMLREFSEAVNAPNRKHLELTFVQRF
ncbi:site-specific DNA-methyltransferase [Alphaproteobacteria bacterium]|nr:site-specific DNA-methyltransferase [Alphaproteobacteria bacterium]